jgi:selenocysteine lyase/cysteine desulfurase
VRRFVGARDSDALIFTRNTTDAFNLLSHCLPADTTVVVFETEHHATLLPWEQHRVIRLTAPASPEAAVRAVADTCRDQRKNGPVLVVVTGASNVTGEIWPVARLAAAAHAHGARIALDAAQLAPHRPFSIADLWVDYVAISGHKVYAPYGAGALIGRADWLAAAPPYLIGGGATASVTDTHTEWKPLPDRHEAGTPNVPGVVALATACHVLLAADRDDLVATERALTAQLIGGLRDIPGVTVHSLFDGAAGVIGVATFTVHGVPSNIVAAALSAEHGIGVRDGAFCAQPLVRRLLGSADCGSVDGTGHAVRASVGLGTTSEHVARLIGAVREIAGRGPALRYVNVDGRPQPLNDSRVLPKLVPWQV